MYQTSNNTNAKKKKKKSEIFSNEYNGLKIG
jgi:hypothetical protein